MVERAELGVEENIDRFVRLNVQEFLISLGLANLEGTRRFLERLLSPVAHRFAEIALQFDQQVGENGLQAAAQQAVRKYVRCLEISGKDCVPASGPVLVISNHPGLADVLALASSIERPDLRIIAQERAILRLLPSITERIIYVPRQVEERLEMIHQVVHHLMNGGAVLTFPAGRIEPDPTVMKGAVDSLSQWSRSILLFTRKVPETTVVPTVVSGVISQKAMYHPLTHLRRTVKDRQRLGYTLQLMVNVLFPPLMPVQPRVDFGEPIPGHTLAEPGSKDRSMETLLACVREIMDSLNPGLTSTS